MILSSWKDTPTKQAILDFVAAVTDESGPDYVPPVERIATFDNDGTLWCEHPVPVQVMAILDGLTRAVQQNPALGEQPLYRAAAEKDMAWFAPYMSSVFSFHPSRCSYAASLASPGGCDAGDSRLPLPPKTRFSRVYRESAGMLSPPTYSCVGAFPFSATGLFHFWQEKIRFCCDVSAAQVCYNMRSTAKVALTVDRHSELRVARMHHSLRKKRSTCHLSLRGAPATKQSPMDQVEVATASTRGGARGSASLRSQ